MISITGNSKHSNSTVKTVTIPQAGTTLYAGSVCNDGRPITESWKYKAAVALGIPIIKAKSKPKVADILKERKELLVDKYKPTSVKDIIGHKEHINQITEWLTNWSTQEKKGLLLTGPPGIGKTSIAHLIATSFGYAVTEYNASDIRSVSKLKGIFALGMRRLQKEVVVMDEVDGAGERGGVAEIADIIRKTNVPIICIANELPPKLKPLQNACLCMKLHRPVKSTIAAAVHKIAVLEGMTITKAEIEDMCEKNSNDIRSLLNALEFYQGGLMVDGQKDGVLRYDLFSATQKLMANKRMKMSDAEDLVYVDYNMIPLMVQEAYAAASHSVEELEAASERISYGDTMNSVLWQTQDWSLLPLLVQNTVSVSRLVSGPAPFQIFPQLLGKMSKKSKHVRFIEAMAKRQRCSSSVMRLDYVDALQTIVSQPLLAEKPDIKGAITLMTGIGINRDDLLETIPAVVSQPVEIPTKVKTALTREWNKMQSVTGKRKAILITDSMEIEEVDEEDELAEVEDQLAAFEI